MKIFKCLWSQYFAYLRMADTSHPPTHSYIPPYSPIFPLIPPYGITGPWGRAGGWAWGWSWSRSTVNSWHCSIVDQCGPCQVPVLRTIPGGHSGSGQSGPENAMYHSQARRAANKRKKYYYFASSHQVEVLLLTFAQSLRMC